MTIYLSTEEISKSENVIGKFLLSLSEKEIDFIKNRYVSDAYGLEREEQISNFEWDLSCDGILGYYLNQSDVCKSSNIIRAFYLRLVREKYPRKYRNSILASDNNVWQRNHRNWRKRIFERDNYKCVDCGTNKFLHAHHIKTRAEFPENEFDIDNGITLCRNCHSKHHPNIGLLK